MHEVSIAASLFEMIQENAAAYQLKQITKVELKIGEMTCLEESSLRFAFEALTKDTVAQEAELIIERVKATARCSRCQDLFEISFYDKLCPKCGIYSNHIVTGYELFIDTLEGE